MAIQSTTPLSPQYLAANGTGNPASARADHFNNLLASLGKTPLRPLRVSPLPKGATSEEAVKHDCGHSAI